MESRCGRCWALGEQGSFMGHTEQWEMLWHSCSDIFPHPPQRDRDQRSKPPWNPSLKAIKAQGWKCRSAAPKCCATKTLLGELQPYAKREMLLVEKNHVCTAASSCITQPAPFMLRGLTVERPDCLFWRAGASLLRGPVFCWKGQKVWGMFGSTKKTEKHFTHAGGVQEADPHAGKVVKRRVSIKPTPHQTKPALKQPPGSSALCATHLSACRKSHSRGAEWRAQPLSLPHLWGQGCMQYCSTHRGLS